MGVGFVSTRNNATYDTGWFGVQYVVRFYFYALFGVWFHGHLHNCQIYMYINIHMFWKRVDDFADVFGVRKSTMVLLAS